VSNPCVVLLHLKLHRPIAVITLKLQIAHFAQNQINNTTIVHENALNLIYRNVQLYIVLFQTFAAKRQR